MEEALSEEINIDKKTSVFPVVMKQSAANDDDDDSFYTRRCACQVFSRKGTSCLTSYVTTVKARRCNDMHLQHGRHKTHKQRSDTQKCYVHEHIGHLETGSLDDDDHHRREYVRSHTYSCYIVNNSYDFKINLDHFFFSSVFIV
jgi:hypothetical protein